jgi:hypothetical protein
LLINKSDKMVVQIHKNCVLIICKINFCITCIFTGGKGWNTVIPAPPAENKFFLVNELRTNFENGRTNSYKLRTNYKHEKNHIFLDEGGSG